MSYLTWPEVPQPWSNKPSYYRKKYRLGYHAAYMNQPAKIFTDPRSQGAQAYFDGFRVGTIARFTGVQHELDIILVPEQFTSGYARKAYRAGYKISREAIEEQVPPPKRIELYFRNRVLFTDNPTWGSGTAFDTGWRAGALATGILSPPLPGEKSQLGTHPESTINGGRTR